MVIDGGPAMGPVINPDTAVITKTTKGLLILPDDIPAITSKLSQNRAVMAHASSNCCQCTLCYRDVPPGPASGYPLRAPPHRCAPRWPARAQEHARERSPSASGLQRLRRLRP